jgi:uncharacterized protein YidB (DUF937 family)
MSLLDSILGNVLGGGGGGGAAGSPLRPILAEILGGLASTGQQGASRPGLGGLLERFTQAGQGGAFNSWVGTGPNQQIDPNSLQNVFGQGQVNQWAQQSGMAPHDLLGQLSQFLPHAVDHMTPDGQVPQPVGTTGGSAFDGPGMP